MQRKGESLSRRMLDDVNCMSPISNRESVEDHRTVRWEHPVDKLAAEVALEI